MRSLLAGAACAAVLRSKASTYPTVPISGTRSEVSSEDLAYTTPSILFATFAQIMEDLFHADYSIPLYIAMRCVASASQL